MAVVTIDIFLFNSCKNSNNNNNNVFKFNNDDAFIVTYRLSVVENAKWININAPDDGPMKSETCRAKT